MKKLIITATVTLVCVGAFAQGKLQFYNNIDNLIYFNPTTAAPGTPGTLAADAGTVVGGFAIAGSSAYTGDGSTIAALAGTPTLIAGLYGGTSAGSLTLQTTTTIDGVAGAGQIIPANSTFATLPSGTPAFFQMQVADVRSMPVLGSSASATAAAWSAGQQYAGQSAIFQAVPQPATFSPVYQTASPVSSTWAPGSYVPVDFVGFDGFFGGTMVSATVPEPGTFALAGLGLAALLVLRRRS